MLDPHVFAPDPWAIIEQSLDLSLLGQTETIFALSNGHIGFRGNLDEGDPHGVPGSYLFYLDVAGSVHEEVVQRALDHLAEVAAFVRVLGSYPRGRRVD